MRQWRGASCESRRTGWFGRTHEQRRLAGAWKEQAVGGPEILGRLCLIGGVPEEQDSLVRCLDVPPPGCVALARLSELLTLPEFQSPVGKMAHRGVRRIYLCT